MERQRATGRGAPWDWLDWGEPSCWACGYFAESWESHDADRPLYDDLALYWDSAKGLDRAHIVARSQFGLDNAANMALLCSRCHELSPDSRHAEVMLDWIRSSPRSTLGQHWTEARLIAEGTSAILGDGPIPSDADVARAMEWLSPGSHLGRLSVGTRLALVRKAVDYARERLGEQST
jgi:hypothetical protein